MTSTGPLLTRDQQLRDMNEALLISSLHQHELTEVAQQGEAAMRESEERFRSLFESAPMALFVCDKSAVIQRYNARAAELWGREPVCGVEKHCGSLKLWLPDGTLLPHDRSPLVHVLRTGIPAQNVEVFIERPDGSRLPVLVNFSALKDAQGEVTGAVTAFVDITERTQAEDLIQCQKQSLEMLVEGDPLELVLDFLARSMELQSQGSFLVAIHLLEADGQHFGEVAAPSLPASYSQATKGLDARLELGPCSSAVVSHKPTVVRDFAAQGRWPAFSAEALALGLRGCWTTPIFSPEQQVLGTLAIYYRQPRDPSPHDRQLVEIVTHTVAIAIERKQAEAKLREAEERFRTLADNIPQLAWIADADSDGEINWFNQNWYDYTGTTLEQMQGQGWHTVHHPDHAERVIQKFAQHVREGLDWEDTFPLRGQDGSFRWFLSRMKVIRDDSGQVLRIFGTNTDVTEQREMEVQISRQALTLVELNRRKDEFLAMLSHELRNPLAPILNAVQLLRLQRDGTEIQREAHAMIERQVTQLARLVDDLLEVSRVSTGRIHLQQHRIDLRGIVQRAVEATRPLCGQKSQTVVAALPPEPIFVHGDSVRLEQVVVNLLNNACKYTDHKGHIWVGLERKDDEAVLRVRDNGIGIAPELLPRIFDLFAQADHSLDRAQGGLGIGLALVQSLVTMHHGRVEAKSTVGQGSEFIVTLPVMLTPGDPAPPPAAEEERPTHSLKVLVVDDNVDAAKGIARLLQAYGHGTRVAHEGADAMQLALEYVPDVVLLDIGLPVITGYQVAKWIRQEPALQDVVLVALTGYGQESDKQLSQAAGFDHHLVKPADFAQVQRILSAVAEQAPRFGTGERNAAHDDDR